MATTPGELDRIYNLKDNTPALLLPNIFQLFPQIVSCCKQTNPTVVVIFLCVGNKHCSDAAGILPPELLKFFAVSPEASVAIARSISVVLQF